MIRFRRSAAILTVGLVLAITPLQPGPASAQEGEWPVPDGLGPTDPSLIPSTPVHGYILTTHEGQVIENVHATGISVHHDNVTIRNFRISIAGPEADFGVRMGKNGNRRARGALIEHGTITTVDSQGQPTPSGAKGVQFADDTTIRHVELSYLGDGVQCARRCIVADTYIHSLFQLDGHHNDGIQFASGVGSRLTGNTIILLDPHGMPQQTGAISLFPTAGPISDVVIAGNVLAGGTYTIYSRTKDHGTPSDIVIRDNLISARHKFGYLSKDGQVTWTNNRWLESGLAISLDTSGTFIDTAGSVHERDIELAAERGITFGCDTDRRLYCPGADVTREQMASFLVRAFSIPPDATDHFDDDDASVHTSAINALAGAGIGRGCNPPADSRFCPAEPVTRGEMAAFLARVLDLPSVAEPHAFNDDDKSIFEGEIAALRDLGIVAGCNAERTRYCPDDTVTRAQMASFLIRALRYR